MLIATIVHPEVFNSASISSVLQRNNLIGFLRGILSNGLILIDQDKKLLAGWKTSLSGTGAGTYRVRICVEELLKKGSPRFIINSGQQFDGGIDPIERRDLLDFSQTCLADGIVVSADAGTTTGLVPIANYNESEFEARRIELGQNHQLDKISREAANEIFIRTTRFSKWLRVYDRQIGQGVNNLRNFERGIAYIVELWVINAHFRNLDSVEIWTCAGDVEPGFLKDKLEQWLIKPLKRRFPALSFRLFVVADSDKDLHARHLQTTPHIIMLERGFDFFKRDGTFKRSFIHSHREAAEHLREFRRRELLLEITA